MPRKELLIKRCERRLRCMTLKLYVLILFVMGLYARVGGETMDALSLADSFAEHGYYYEAVTEYKRHLFLQGDTVDGDVYSRLGLSYFYTGEWGKAKVNYQKAMLMTDDDSLRDDYQMQLSACMMGQEENKSAEIELLKIQAFSAFPSMRCRASLLLAVCRVKLGKWDEAKRDLGVYLDDSSSIDSLFNGIRKTMYRSPEKARLLSIILPGAGQMYAGDYINSLNAFGLNGLLLYLMLHSLVNREYQDALISFLPLVQRYYKGNYYNAEQICKRRNEQIDKVQCEVILEKIRVLINGNKQ